MSGKIEQVEQVLTDSVAQTEQVLTALGEVVEGDQSAGGVPEGWLAFEGRECVLIEKNDIVDGPFGSNLKATEYQDSGVPIIRIQNVKRLTFIDKNIKYVTPEKAEFLKRHSFKPNDILITKLGEPLGLACIAPKSFGEGVIVADIVRFRCAEEFIDRNYICYAINSPSIVKQIESHTKGTTRQRINLTIIRDLKIPMAPLAEQTVIAQTLDTLLAQVDNIKTRLDAIPKILKTFRQSVLAAAVSGKLTEEWRGVNEYRESELGIDFPSSWKMQTINDCAEVKGGKRLPKGEELLEEDTGLRYIRAGQLKNGTVINGNAARNKQLYLKAEVQEQIKRYIVASGDAYLTIVGASIGDAGIVPENYDGANLTENAAKICEYKQPTCKPYIGYWLRSSIIQDLIKLEIKSGAQGKLALKRIKTLPIPAISIEEQTEIVRRVEELFAFAEQIEQQVKNAQRRVNNLTQSILAKAFRGELTTQWRAENSDLISGENSAEALLAKIKEEREKLKTKKKSSTKKTTRKIAK
jgi:type I restriction enzyme S subunit